MESADFGKSASGYCVIRLIKYFVLKGMILIKYEENFQIFKSLSPEIG
jgi:hypothetical protein